jgi:hypothetical protein
MYGSGGIAQHAKGGRTAAQLVFVMSCGHAIGRLVISAAFTTVFVDQRSDEKDRQGSRSRVEDISVVKWGLGFGV